jgi:16S rRNA U516 pseudouridylate synthase RsuA-like enzyme
MRNFITFKEWMLVEKEYQESDMKALEKLNNALNLGLNIDDPDSRTIKLSSLKDAQEKLKTNTMYKNLDDAKKKEIENIFHDVKSNLIQLARIFA